MTKKDFLNELVAGLSRGMRTEDMAELRDYYAEQIDDRMEEGLSEEEAVAALGDPAALAEKLLRENGGARPAGDGEHIYGAVERLDLRLIGADAKITVQPLSGGETARLRFASKCRWTLEDGALIIEEEDVKQGLFGRMKSSPLELTLSGAELARLEVHSRAGDLRARGLRVSGALTAEMNSGDIRLEDVEADECTIGSGSGDVAVQDLRANLTELKSANGDIEVQDLVTSAFRGETANGDVSLKGIRTETAELRTANGDIEVQTLTAGELHARTANGDVELADASVAGRIELESTSGDIDLRRVSAAEMELSTRSGDIKGTLMEAEGGYRFEAQTPRGDLNVPNTEGRRLVGAISANGDIHLKVEA